MATEVVSPSPSLVAEGLARSDRFLISDRRDIRVREGNCRGTLLSGILARVWFIPANGPTSFRFAALLSEPDLLTSSVRVILEGFLRCRMAEAMVRCVCHCCTDGLRVAIKALNWQVGHTTAEDDIERP
jgi:hypothetical protein